MIRIRNLCIRLGQFSFENVNLDVHDGEYFVVLGPTGAGKTVLVECIAGLHRIEEGEIWINGNEVSRLSAEDRSIGYVPQDYVLFPHISVEGNIRFGMRGAGRTASSSNSKAVEEIVDLLGLRPLLSRRPQNLSGGEKQRVALARALAIEPKLLLMDEPFAALDPGLRHRLWVETLKIQRITGTTTVHITHDLEEAFTLSKNVAILCDGRIEQVGRREDVFFRPRTKATASFLGLQNIFEGQIVSMDSEEDATTIRCGRFDVVAPFKSGLQMGQRVTTCVHPQEVKVMRKGRTVKESLRWNLFPGKVVATTPHGTNYTIYFKIAESALPSDRQPKSNVDYDFELRLPTVSYYKLDLAEGKEVAVSLRKAGVVILED